MSGMREAEQAHYRYGREDMAEELNDAAVRLVESGALDFLEILGKIGREAGLPYWEETE